ncbi:spore germination protein [Halalkalibacterium halodurans]|uniref:spore germination protein n=1 Tax=Halalkalibacterium halodurans TaxID=86665 RepID=UPI002E1E8393|nr:spore germination protein [Halalkalibacterium halodurans]
MSFFKRKGFRRLNHQVTEKIEERLEQQPKHISTDLIENLQQVKNIFTHCEDLVVLHWRYGPEMAHTAFSVYFDSLVQRKMVNYMKASLQDLVPDEVGPGEEVTPDDIISHFEQNIASAHSHRLVKDFDDVIEKITNGHIVIFFNQWDKALAYKAISVETRQVDEPPTEPVIKGPREGTIENLDKNIGLIRGRLKSANFKIEMFTCKGETRTRVAYGYVDGLVDPKVLAEFKQRVKSIPEGDILETSYIEELIEDSTYSPFPQYRYTERPDTAVAALLDGKIIVMVDGTGSILICPSLFVELMQSSEDYYQRAVFASSIRFLRVIALMIALTLPALYIALTTFHPELIPTVLLLAIIDAREGIPFPSLIEALIMMIFFELLREAGVRLPRPVGAAVSIVGALVLGEAAIQAGIASPIMVIVVALTGIASFALPQYTFAIALRLLQFPLMVLAALLGGFGLMIGLILIWLHLVSLHSLGQPYLSPVGPFKFRELRDVFIRAPFKTLIKSPRKRPYEVRGD